jgi:hypothetical protein
MSGFKIGELYDPSFKTMSEVDIKDNLEAIAWGVQEKSYTKNLTPEEVAEKKDKYAEIGLTLSDIAREKKEFAERMKEREKEPKAEADVLLQAIKFKSEQKHGELFLIDDQEAGIMYLFDSTGTCVEARQLDKKERQLKLKKAGNDEI